MIVTTLKRNDFGIFPVMTLFLGVQASFRNTTIPNNCVYLEGRNSQGIRVVTENPIPEQRLCQIYWEIKPLLPEPIPVEYAVRAYYALTKYWKLGCCRGQLRNFALTRPDKVLDMLNQKQWNSGVCIYCEGMQFKNQPRYPACKFCCGTGDKWAVKPVQQHSMDSDIVHEGESCSKDQHVVAQVSPRPEGVSPLARNDSGEYEPPIIRSDDNRQQCHHNVVGHSQVVPGMTVTHCGSYCSNSEPESPSGAERVDALQTPVTNPVVEIRLPQSISPNPVVELPKIEVPRSERPPSPLVSPGRIDEKQSEVGVGVLIPDTPPVKREPVSVGEKPSSDESDGSDKIEKLCLTLTTKRLFEELERAQKDDLTEEPNELSDEPLNELVVPDSPKKRCSQEDPEPFFHSVHPDYDRDFMCVACDRNYCDGQCTIATRLEQAEYNQHSVNPEDQEFLCEECENVMCCGGCERQTKTYVRNHTVHPDEQRDVLCQRCKGLWCDTTCRHALESETPAEVKDLVTYRYNYKSEKK